MENITTLLKLEILGVSKDGEENGQIALIFGILKIDNNLVILVQMMGHFICL